MKMSIVARTTTKLVAPFLTTYAAYLMIYTTQSPGGGFQAGVILAVALILLITSHGYKSVRKYFRKRVASSLESVGGLATITIFFLTVLLFLRPSEVYVVPANVFIGLKVGAAFTLMFYALISVLERD
ncbi:cation:proton antiporter [Pyrococcus furiosus DSM 3638]|uniref:Cation:proton antiporter n=3 Tax=Pyrococcus furiosus TaxID=2261 RepID=A0A5C0XSI1_PYRFU|nr:Na(+)/H(+) antiporter subunit B [Pyrococcus furiosus]AAL81273.1 putative multisubunit Na+/H+ antiporter [Pyrococcus furiosus DSM 3638]AFN03941.1 monovalent cation/H+ antiporter subunit B [Pyrococcus furiosus COM1]QEK78804.1 cation:proton antiporter [Pyrococcus furiosus DSM 3638]